MRAAITSFLILGFCGCATIHYRTEVGRVPPRDVDVIAVAPVVLAFPHRSHEAYEKTQNVVAALRAAQIVIIGPEELAAGVSWRRQAAGFGLVPERLAVLEARVERREENTWAVTYNRQKQRDGYLHLWIARYRIVLELVDSDGAVLARTAGEAVEERDDLAAADAAERYPKLREALAVMVTDLLGRTAAAVRLARATPPAGLTVDDVHARLMREPEVAREVARLEGVERDVYEVVRYRYFDPAFPASWLPAVRRAGGGALVRDARGTAAATGLQPGDVITAVDGAPVAGAAAFVRALARGGARLTVLRGRELPLALTLAPAGGRLARAPAPARGGAGEACAPSRLCGTLQAAR